MSDDLKSTGLIRGQKDPRDYTVGSLFPEATEYPTSFKYDYNRPVKNQSWIQSCVAHSWSYILEIMEKKRTGLDVEISTGFIYANRSEDMWQGSGMNIPLSAKMIKNFGAVHLSVFPQTDEYPSVKQYLKSSMYPIAKQRRITAYFRIDSAEDIKKALVESSPVMFARKMYSKWAIPLESNGWKFNTKAPDSSTAIYHCMTIIGWREDNCFIVLNSEGTKGDNGYYYYPFDQAERDMRNGEAWDFFSVTDLELATIPKKYYGRGSDGSPTVSMFKGKNELVSFVRQIDTFRQQGYEVHESITPEKLEELKEITTGINDEGLTTYKRFYINTGVETWVTDDWLNQYGENVKQ